MVAQLLEDSFGFAAFLGFGLSLGQFVCDRGFKPWIAGKAEDIVNAVRLATSPTIGGYILAKVDNQPYEPGSHRVQQTAWAGATYLVAPWTFSIAYYHLSQNPFLTAGSGGATCAMQTSNNIATGAIGNKTGSNCPGDYRQGSVLVEYAFSKHLDLYGGISYSEATGGVASGYINDNTALILTGMRLKF